MLELVAFEIMNLKAPAGVRVVNLAPKVLTSENIIIIDLTVFEHCADFRTLSVTIHSRCISLSLCTPQLRPLNCTFCPGVTRPE